MPDKIFKSHGRLLQIQGAQKKHFPLKSSRGTDLYFLETCKLNNYEPPKDYGLAIANLFAMMKDFFKYNHDRYEEIDEPLLKRVAVLLLEKLRPACIKTQRLTFDQAIPLVEPSAAAGWIWNQRGCPTKGLVLEKYPIELYFAVMLLFIQHMAVYWTISPKEEIRTMEKIEAGQRRAFLASTFELQVVSVMLYWPMDRAVEIYYHNQDNNFWVGPSKNKFRLNWHRLFCWLREFSNLFGSGDASQYDSSIPALLMYYVHWVRMAIMGKDIASINYMLNTIYSFCINEMGEIFVKVHGNSSGSGTTLTDNNYCLWIMVVYSLLKYAQRTGTHVPVGEEMRYVDQHVRFVLCGDDFLGTVTNRYVFTVLNYEMQHFGVIYKFKVAMAEENEQGLYADIEFCNTGFKNDKRRKLVVPAPNAKKMIASLVYAAKYAKSPRMSWVRACAVRTELWTSDECWIVEKHIDRMKKEELRAIKADSPVDKLVGFEAAMKSYLTPGELNLLYFAQL